MIISLYVSSHGVTMISNHDHITVCVLSWDDHDDQLQYFSHRNVSIKMSCLLQLQSSGIIGESNIW